MSTLDQLAYEAWKAAMLENPHRCVMTWDGGDVECVADRHRSWKAAVNVVLEEASQRLRDHASTLPHDVLWDGPMREARPSGRQLGLVEAADVLARFPK